MSTDTSDKTRVFIMLPFDCSGCAFLGTAERCVTWQNIHTSKTVNELFAMRSLTCLCYGKMNWRLMFG